MTYPFVILTLLRRTVAKLTCLAPAHISCKIQRPKPPSPAVGRLHSVPGAPSLFRSTFQILTRDPICNQLRVRPGEICEHHNREGIIEVT